MPSRRKASSKTKTSFGCFSELMTIQLALSKKSTSPAVMFTSRLVLPSAMTWTEKSACVANLPHVHKHTRALFLLLAVVMVLLLYRRWFWCCYYSCLQPFLLSSLLTKKRKKRERHKKQRKQRTSGRFFSPTTNFLVGNCGLRRAERWDDMPSMCCEVGEI